MAKDNKKVVATSNATSNAAVKNTAVKDVAVEVNLPAFIDGAENDDDDHTFTRSRAHSWVVGESFMVTGIRLVKDAKVRGETLEPFVMVSTTLGEITARAFPEMCGITWSMQKALAKKWYTGRKSFTITNITSTPIIDGDKYKGMRKDYTLE